MKDYFLLADVGGTFCRFGLATEGGHTITHHAVLEAANFTGFEAALDAYLVSQGLRTSDLYSACIAVAAAALGDTVQLTNSPWVISCQSLKARYRLQRVVLINDFEALAWAARGPIPLGRNPLVLGDGSRSRNGGNTLLIGPGTGLGVAALVSSQRTESEHSLPVVCASEGGHSSFAPVDELDIELLRYCSARYSRVSTERVLSGPGLVTLYDFYSQHIGDSKASLTTAKVIALAEEQSDQVATWAVQRFLSLLGSYAGDCVLTFRAFNGVLLAGGLLRRMPKSLAQSDLHERFCDKGRLSPIMQTVPIDLITDDHAALRGAWQYLTQGDGQITRHGYEVARQRALLG